MSVEPGVYIILFLSLLFFIGTLSLILDRPIKNTTFIEDDKNNDTYIIMDIDYDNF